VPEVIEEYAITGEADPLLKVVAPDTADLRASPVNCSPSPRRFAPAPSSPCSKRPLCVRALLEEAADGCRPTRLAFARSHGGSW
jgi:DNA-binding Lrp family transcriptional regulator